MINRNPIRVPLVAACAVAVAACGPTGSSEVARFDSTPKSCAALTKSTASAISDFAGSIYTNVGLSRQNLDALPPTPGVRDYGCQVNFVAADVLHGPTGTPTSRSVTVSFKLYESGVSDAKDSFQVLRDTATGKPKVSAAQTVAGIGDEGYVVDDASTSSARTTVTFRSSNLKIDVTSSGADFVDGRMADGPPSSGLVAGVHSAAEAIARAVAPNLESIVNDD